MWSFVNYIGSPILTWVIEFNCISCVRLAPILLNFCNGDNHIPDSKAHRLRGVILLAVFYDALRVIVNVIPTMDPILDQTLLLNPFDRRPGRVSPYEKQERKANSALEAVTTFLGLVQPTRHISFLRFKYLL